MKTFFLSIVLMFITVLPAFAQMEANVVAKTGMLTGQGDTEQFGIMTGANLKLFSDSAANFTVYNFTGYLYVEKETDADGAKKSGVDLLIVQKRFTDLFGTFDPYVALGKGFIYDFPSETGMFALSLELGGHIMKSISVSLSDLYLPSSGRHFVSFNIDLMPVF